MIPPKLKKALASLDPLPRTKLNLLATSSITPLTGQKIHQLLHTLGFVHVIKRTNLTLGELINAEHVVEIHTSGKPRRYMIARKYIAAANQEHTP